MEYKFKNIDNHKNICHIEILSLNEFEKQYPQIFKRSFSSIYFYSMHFCRIDKLSTAIIGIFSVPNKEDVSDKRDFFCFCIVENKIIFIDNEDYALNILNKMESSPLTDISSPYLLLFDFLENIIKDDVIFLQQYDEKLSLLEESLLNETHCDFDKKIFSYRRDLSVLSLYYEQLSDVGETLEQNAAEENNDRCELLFHLYSNKAARLYSSVQMLKEYSIQLREMHQTQIDMHQNEIMKFLTIVTTIFMPLTLVAGWYGMNFVNMPELSFRYGYIIISILCILIVIFEILFFKSKKWFK